MSPTLPSRQSGQFAAFFLITQYILMLSAFIILSSAIDWPQSLDDPASIALPRVLGQSQFMLLGYGFYFLVGILFIPATVALNARLGITGSMASMTVALATFSAIAKSIGITRWLFAMPTLAEAYVAPGADTQTIGAIFAVLNEYAGGIGEILGVGLMSGIWTILMARELFKKPGKIAKPLAVFVFLTALILFATIPAGFGIDMGPVLTVSGIIWQAGLLAMGLWALTSPPEA
jgi:hypothetical protein